MSTTSEAGSSSYRSKRRPSPGPPADRQRSGADSESRSLTPTPNPIMNRGNSQTRVSSDCVRPPLVKITPDPEERSRASSVSECYRSSSDSLRRDSGSKYQWSRSSSDGSSYEGDTKSIESSSRYRRGKKEKKKNPTKTEIIANSWEVRSFMGGNDGPFREFKEKRKALTRKYSRNPPHRTTSYELRVVCDVVQGSSLRLLVEFFGYPYKSSLHGVYVSDETVVAEIKDCDLGLIRACAISLDSPDGELKLSYLGLTNLVTGDEYIVPCCRWFSDTRGDNSKFRILYGYPGRSLVTQLNGKCEGVGLIDSNCSLEVEPLKPHLPSDSKYYEYAIRGEVKGISWRVAYSEKEIRFFCRCICVQYPELTASMPISRLDLSISKSKKEEKRKSFEEWLLYAIKTLNAINSMAMLAMLQHPPCASRSDVRSLPRQVRSFAVRHSEVVEASSERYRLKGHSASPFIPRQKRSRGHKRENSQSSVEAGESSVGSSSAGVLDNRAEEQQVPNESPGSTRSDRPNVQPVKHKRHERVKDSIKSRLSGKFGVGAF